MTNVAGETLRRIRAFYTVEATMRERGLEGAEKATRTFAVGRRPGFRGSPRGAEASTMLFTLVETAKAAGLKPRAYLH